MMSDKIKNLVFQLIEEIEQVKNMDEKIEVINEVRKSIHKVSPLKNHPVDCVLWIKSEDVEANEYNPNSVAPPEMSLLITSILKDGYTMPIVTYKEKNIKIVDGFHRRKAEVITEDIRNSTMGRIPLTFIRKTQEDVSNRMASTIRHNRARGTHNIDLMVNIVSELVKAGMSDSWILKNIGMDTDELLRLKQISGLTALFKDKTFSESEEF